MLPGMELMGCQLEVPAAIMHHVVKVESSYNPYAIGVVGGRLAHQPRNLPEAVATAQYLAQRGFNFSLGLAQVNRYNLGKYRLPSYQAAFQPCNNLLAGSQILRECHSRSGGHWGRAFSCYYSGNFTTGYRQGYVQKIQRSMVAQRSPEMPALAIPVIDNRAPRQRMGATAGQPTRTAPPTRRAVAVSARAASYTDGGPVLTRRIDVPPPASDPTLLAANPVTTAAEVPTDVPPAAAVVQPTAAKRPAVPPGGADAAFVF